MGARGVGRFKNAKAEERFLAAYDAFRDQNWPVPFTDLDVPTRFGSTHVRRSGAPEGSPIVLLHPNSGTSMSWYRLVAPLARRHAVYALDTIGTAGRSVQSTPVHNATDLATWLDDAMTELALDGVNLVGYSEGGWLAALATVHAPARLASVTLIEPGGAICRVRPSLIARTMVTGVSVYSGLRRPERAMRKFARWMSPDVEITDGEMQLLLIAMLGFRGHIPYPRPLDEDSLRAVRTPTLVLIGADTVLFDPVEAAARVKWLIPNVEVDIVEGTGHGLPLAKPQYVTQRILGFIADPACPSRP